jgi:hypothetical protein
VLPCAAPDALWLLGYTHRDVDRDIHDAWDTNAAARGSWSVGGEPQGELMRRPLAEPMQQRSGIISDAVCE